MLTMSRQLAPHYAKEHEPGGFRGEAILHHTSRLSLHRAGLLTSGYERSLPGLPT